MNRSERFLLFLLWWTLFRRILTWLDRKPSSLRPRARSRRRMGFANLSGPERKKE